MTEADRDLARLREAFLEGVSEALPQAGDPDPETIWKAVNGQLPAEETRAVLDRAVSSPSCAREWVLARRMSLDENGQEPVARRSGLRRYAIAAMAAGILLAVTLVAWYASRATTPPVYRGVVDEVVSLVPDGASLRRDAATLEWKPVAGARGYNLRVLKPDFGVLVLKEGLTSPFFTIPEDRLGDIEDGGEVQWQVEVLYSDGTKSLSRLFHAVVKGSGDGV